MEPTGDIRLLKAEIRRRALLARKRMTDGEKAEADAGVAARVRKLGQYRAAGTVLVYVSKAFEVGTEAVIANAFADGKKVAVPRCVPGGTEMVFHYIFPGCGLSPGAFSVPEPPEDFPRVTEFSDCVALVPGLAFDRRGYRVGYGGGYYDRFLRRYTGAAAGLCYEADRTGSLPRGKFDVSVPVVVTERKIYNTLK